LLGRISDPGLVVWDTDIALLIIRGKLDDPALKKIKEETSKDIPLIILFYNTRIPMVAFYSKLFQFTYDCSKMTLRIFPPLFKKFLEDGGWTFETGRIPKIDLPTFDENKDLGVAGVLHHFVLYNIEEIPIAPNAEDFRDMIETAIKEDRLLDSGIIERCREWAFDFDKYILNLEKQLADVLKVKEKDLLLPITKDKGKERKEVIGEEEKEKERKEKKRRQNPKRKRRQNPKRKRKRSPKGKRKNPKRKRR